MRSDAIDRLLSRALEQPVRLSWQGGVADALLGSFDDARLELRGVATAWLPLERVGVSARHARLRAGVPARIRVEEPVVSISLAQADVDRWLERTGLPFRLELREKGLVLHTEIAGLALSEFETRLEVVRGWFVLKPQRASILGVPSSVARLFRTYLPIPPLSPDARLVGIDHDPGRLSLRFGLDDFEESVTPGLVWRLQRRLLPWVGSGRS